MQELPLSRSTLSLNATVCHRRQNAGRDWPWPFRVSVLGAFRLLKGDAPIRCSRRTQKKTLELLQALIAFGGTEVAAGKLIDALWPDSDGDAGYHALESALYRLRLLLGAPGAVVMAGSKLSLDRQYFWVDMWAFEKALHSTTDHSDAAERFAQDPGSCTRVISCNRKPINRGPS